MLTEPGRVVAQGEGFVWVETERRSSCGACAARHGCGTGLLARRGAGPVLVRAWSGKSLKSRDVKLGDEVMLAMDESAFLLGSVTLYLLPLFGLLAGALLLRSLVPGDPAAVAGAVLGLLSGAAAARVLARVRLSGPRFEPVLSHRRTPALPARDVSIPLS